MTHPPKEKESTDRHRCSKEPSEPLCLSQASRAARLHPALARSFQEATVGFHKRSQPHIALPGLSCSLSTKKTRPGMKPRLPLLRCFSTLKADASLAGLSSWKHRGAASCQDSFTLSNPLVQKSKVGTRQLHLHGTWVSSNGVLCKGEEC